MRIILVLALLVLPLCAAAQDSEIDLLKRELEALRELNAEYVSRLAEMERRLTAIESAERIAEAPPDVPREDREHFAATDEPGDPAPFTTGFDPNRFDFYGYMRAGYGIDSDGTSQTRFKAPGAVTAYRLGNETDTYMEPGFAWYHAGDSAGDPVFGTHFRLAYSTLDKNTGVDLEGDSGVVALREVYATARQVVPGQPGATLWAGQRYYDRRDIHINDFFWIDMSGYGAGIENVDAGFAKVSFAWIGGTTDKFTGRNEPIGDLDATDKNNFDLRLKDMDVGIGRATLWLNYSDYRLAAREFDPVRADGWSGGFWIDSEISADWSNLAAVQYGTSVAANFNSFSPSLRGSIDGEFPENTSAEDQRRLRILDAMDVRLNDHWSIEAVAVYQRDDLGVEGDPDLKWYSLGFRPVYSFNSLYNLALEAGYDYTDLETGESGGLFKLTAAGEITPDFGFFSRPAIRLYLTWATWSNEFRGLIGGTTYADDTSGLAVGAQFESWW